MSNWNTINDIAKAIVVDTANAIETAHGMIAEAQAMATAKVEAKRYSNCVSCQLLMENFLLAYPTATQRGKDEYFSEVVFETCTPCQDEYNAYLDSIAPVDEVLDNPSDWERQNLETRQITATIDKLSNGYGLGAGEESVYFVDTAPVTCECGREYHHLSRKVNASRINGIANGCTECKPDRKEREIAKAASRCRLRLAQHIAKSRNGGQARTIHRDVAIRYLQRFDGQTFAVQTGADTAEIYLEDAKGSVIGKVLYTDKYPKPPPPEAFADMPY